MNKDEITSFARRLQNMREAVSEFRDEFATASDADLRKMIEAQIKISEDANWRADAAETELNLRQLTAIAMGDVSNG